MTGHRQDKQMGLSLQNPHNHVKARRIQREHMRARNSDSQMRTQLGRWKTEGAGVGEAFGEGHLRGHLLEAKLERLKGWGCISVVD